MGFKWKDSARFDLIGGDKDITWGDLALQFATAGQSTSAVQSNLEKRKAEEQAKVEAARVQKEQDRRNEYIGKIRDIFGVGTGADSAGNHKRLSDALNRYYQDNLRSNLGSVTQGYSGASRVSRQNLARAGQLGSSLDSQSRSGNLADFLRGRQQSIQQAGKVKQDLASSLERMRTGLESNVSNGSLTNPDFTNIANEQSRLLESARSNVQPAVIGSLFRQAGSNYYNGRVQEGQGNRGLQSFGIGGGNRGGSFS